MLSSNEILCLNSNVIPDRGIPTTYSKIAPQKVPEQNTVPEQVLKCTNKPTSRKGLIVPESTKKANKILGIDEAEKVKEVSVARSLVEKWQKKAEEKIKLKKKETRVFHPFDPFIWWWNMMNSVIMIYIVIDVPFELAFGVDESLLSPTGCFELILCLFFILDIVINFRTGFIANQILVTTSREIALHYLKGWFTVDLVTTIPFQFILSARKSLSVHGGSATKIMRIMKVFRLVKLFRIFKIMRTMSAWERDDGISLTLTRFMKFVLLAFLVAHLAACGWRTALWPYNEEQSRFNEHTWAARYDVEDISTGELYLICLYWSFTTLCTVGYGDITAGTPFEYLYAICVMVAGSSLFGFIVGNIASLATHENGTTLLIRNKISAVSAYMRYRQLPEDIQQRIRQHYEISWKQTQVYDEEQILSELPPTIRTDAALFIHRDTIERVRFLKELGTDIVPLVVTKLKPTLAAPSEVIIKEGFVGREMYLCMSGYLESYIGGNNNIGVDILAKELLIKKIPPGREFAEYALLFNVIKHPTSVKSLCFCDLFILHKADFDEIAKLFPPAVQYVRELGMTRFKQLLEELRLKQNITCHTEDDAFYQPRPSAADRPLTLLKRRTSHLSSKDSVLSSLDRSQHSISTSRLKLGLHSKMLSQKKKKYNKTSAPLDTDHFQLQGPSSFQLQAPSRRATMSVSAFLSMGGGASAKISPGLEEDKDEEGCKRNVQLEKMIVRAFQKHRNWTSTDDFTPDLRNKIMLWKSRSQMSLAIRRLEEAMYHESSAGQATATQNLKYVKSPVHNISKSLPWSKNQTPRKQSQTANFSARNSVSGMLAKSNATTERLNALDARMAKMNEENLANFLRIESLLQDLMKTFMIPVNSQRSSISISNRNPIISLAANNLEPSTLTERRTESESSVDSFISSIDNVEPYTVIHDV